MLAECAADGIQGERGRFLSYTTWWNDLKAIVDKNSQLYIIENACDELHCEGLWNKIWRAEYLY